MPARFHQHCLATALLAWSVGGFSAVAVAAPAVADAEPAAETTDLVDDYFTQLAEPDGAQAAAAVGAEILRDHADDALMLDSLAWGILTDDALPQRDLPLALRAARKVRHNRFAWLRRAAALPIYSAIAAGSLYIRSFEFIRQLK